jgi:hypothetical protein
MKSLEKSVLINIVLFIIVSRIILSLIGAFSVELIKIFPFHGMQVRTHFWMSGQNGIQLIILI